MKVTTQIFNLKINGRTTVRVLIFKNKRYMRLYAKEAFATGRLALIAGSKTKFYARAYLYRVKAGLSGVATFCDEWIGAGTVAHEMTHCAVNHLQNVGGMPSRGYTLKNDDEKLAMLIDDLCRQFWKKFHRKNRK